LNFIDSLPQEVLLPDPAISRVLEAARRKLLDTGTRNRLIHVNRANSRANCLNIINERADAVHGLLRLQNRKMRFKAMGKDRGGDGQDMLLALPEPDIPDGADRLTDTVLETPLGPEALARRLLRLATDAKTAEEEQGLNILYLAIGFLQWRESPSSETAREAPLILLPVQLTRNERSSTYDIQCRDDDIATNLPLQQRLRTDFGISLPEIEESEDWRPSDYFAKVRDAVSSQPGWTLDADGMQLGFFSFAKLLMHRDLDPSTWPEGAFAENNLLRGLLAEGFEAPDAIFGPEDRLDELLDPAEIVQVIDADASQTKVIEEVRRGSSLVVQGPPGTGKSQTITNLIAAAAHDGKSVLFVAEKMAALSVVHDRLVRAGLRDICLELHSRTANKKALAQELGRTLMASAQALPGTPDPARLRETRDRLNRITALLHDPLPPTGATPFRAIAEIIGFIGEGAPPPCIPLEELDALDKLTRDRACAALTAYAEALVRAGPPEAHPFRGTGALDLQPPDLARLESELADAMAAIDALLSEGQRLAVITGLEAPHTLEGVDNLVASLQGLGGQPPEARDWIVPLFGHAQSSRLTEALGAGTTWAEARQASEGDFAVAAWTTDVAAMRTALARGQASFFSRLFGGYRRASAELAGLVAGPLPKAPSERLARVDRILQVQALRRALADEEPWLQATLGPAWRGERTPFAAAAAAASWMARLQKTGAIADADQLTTALDAIPDPTKAADHLAELSANCRHRIGAPVTRLQLDLTRADLGTAIDRAPLYEMRSAFAQMATEPARYGDWVGLARAIATAVTAGAEGVVDAVADGRVPPARAAQEFAYACAEARWTAARRARPELNELPQLNRHDLVSLFADLEKDRIDTARNLILSRHFEQMPRGTMGEMGIIRGEIARKRGHKPIRWVMRKAGSIVQRIKPVMLMSPISVAQFLPPGSAQFDILVIDEASQIRPEDALGVIARARQIVVVGDQKQLPPTSFFDRLVDDVEENDEEEEEEKILGATAADMESILSLCEARGLRQRMLEWHYRSRDPSLIRVNNAEFYEDRLVLPPSPLQLDPDYGLKFRRVPGVYARGSSGLGRQGTNRIEAEAVVAAMANHARNWPDLSLGVVAFSKAQATMLTEVLELHRRRDPVLDAFLREGKAEDVFVKNIENVQGDERDVILISVGYGPQEPGGRLPSMSFGPVNGEGGERRLNVLFSRSRVRCEVFASFDPGDIDPSRSSREGPRVLKRFLDFAKTGQIESHAPTGLDADSPFEEDVARVIRGQGFLADPQVGSRGFRIDIGVRHPDRPGQYLLAVECDGAAYHSALWARERDRLRQGILETLGWRFHRIWSTDWFHHRTREIDRLQTALQNARAAMDDSIRVRGANHGSACAVAVPKPAPEQPVAIDIDHLALTAPAYVRADLSIRASVEPHEAPLQQLAELVSRIVAIEGPIHVDEIARRIAAAFGRSRTGNRIADATARAVRSAMQRDKELCREGAFVMTAAQAEASPVRDRSAETGSILKASYLPPSEIVAAAEVVRQESGEVPQEDLVRAVARLLGFQRVGTELAAAIEAALAKIQPKAGTDL
jgi:DNA polymerase III delta prime subunit